MISPPDSVWQCKIQLTFSLEFHFPYMAWRKSSSPQVDTRQCEGKPLRKFIDLSFLAGFIHDDNDDKKSQERPYLYEAQTTCLVSGLDHYVWDAVGLVDTYFEEDPKMKRDCKYFEDIYESDAPLPPDFIPAGAHTTNLPIWTPREYFLKVLESRLAQIVKEWENLVDWITHDILDYVCLQCQV